MKKIHKLSLLIGCFIIFVGCHKKDPEPDVRERFIGIYDAFETASFSTNPPNVAY